jgi:cytochrome c biogenesis protein CcmG/thiol:disulfide interchange protein DsbE
MSQVRPRSRFIRSVLGCALLSVGLIAPVAARAPERPARAPSFVLPARAGSVSLDSLRGHVVYLDFWASWCGPCRASFPWMAGLVERYKGRGLRVVAVNLDKDRELADAFLADHPAAFTVAFDPKGRTAEAYKVAAMPTSFVIGKDGSLLLRHAGFDPRHTDEVEKRIQEALAP